MKVRGLREEEGRGKAKFNHNGHRHENKGSFDYDAGINEPLGFGAGVFWGTILGFILTMIIAAGRPELLTEPFHLADSLVTFLSGVFE